MKYTDQSLKHSIHTKLTSSRISQRGFTLIELLVAVAIIGILSSFLISSFVGARQRARDAERKSDLRQIQAAVEFFKADSGTYPDPTSDMPGCGGTLDSATGQVYLKQLPCDPLNKTEKYNYTCGTGCNTYTIFACIENTKDLQAVADPVTLQPVKCADNKRVKVIVSNPS